VIGKENSFYINIYFFEKNDKYLKFILDHKKWFNNKKNDFTLEDLTIIKFLKSFRRCKNLKYLKSELIEILTHKSGTGSICEKVIEIISQLKDEIQNSVDKQQYVKTSI